jgi:hypothetical protein
VERFYTNDRMRGMRRTEHNPNPNGKAGKPISIPPMSFEDAVRKMLATAPPKAEPKPAKKPARKR